MLLADLGADVVKVENPETGGDVARTVPPYAVEGDSVYFQAFNRNKRSITLNLQHPEARAVLHALVRRSDAVFNNLRGDLPDKLGLTYARLQAVKPEVVCCSLSAFGRTGRRAVEPGYDYLMQGYAGWMSITGEPGTPPQKSGLSLVDLTAGIMASLGLVSAVLRARETGMGGDVDVSLFDTALSELCYVGAWHLTRGYEPQRLPDSSHPSQIPSQVLPSQDGWFVVMCAKEKFWQRLVEAMGAPELAVDPRFRTFADRLRNREILGPILKDLSRQKTTAEWLELLRGQVPCAPVNSVAEALADPQVLEDEMILEVPHPAFGVVRELASPIKIADARRDHCRAPSLGEHTREVLGEAGFSAEEVDALYARGVL
jgi:crotonobetainyl-CoA:carnitine CoA-transferase CaiB-like acyl-CoA transferase